MQQFYQYILSTILSISIISSKARVSFIFKLFSLEIGQWQHLYDLVGTN